MIKCYGQLVKNGFLLEASGVNTFMREIWWQRQNNVFHSKTRDFERTPVDLLQSLLRLSVPPLMCESCQLQEHFTATSLLMACDLGLCQIKTVPCTVNQFT